MSPGLQQVKFQFQCFTSRIIWIGWLDLGGILRCVRTNSIKESWYNDIQWWTEMSLEIKKVEISHGRCLVIWDPSGLVWLYEEQHLTLVAYVVLRTREQDHWSCWRRVGVTSWFVSSLLRLALNILMMNEFSILISQSISSYFSTIGLLNRV